VLQNESEDVSALRIFSRRLSEAQSRHRGLSPDEYYVAFDEESLANDFPNDEEHVPENREFDN
jgi:hypothetical protein